jgi:hypothetical protein
LELVPLYDNASLVQNRGRNYSAVGDVAGFLGFETTLDVASLADCCQVVDVNTWTDPVMGSACGDATVLADMLAEYIESMRNISEKKPLLVVLCGSFTYMDASVHVHEWLCERTNEWRSHNRNTSRLFVAVHIRVPEEWCHSGWKEVNSVDKFMRTLEALFGIDEFMNLCDLDVYTELSFTSKDEDKLRDKFPQVVVHRGSSETILSDLKAMAKADIFVASSSHFSALAAYLCGPDCLLILANDKENEYFEPHKKLGCRVFHRNHPLFKSAVTEKIQQIKNASIVFGSRTVDWKL